MTQKETPLGYDELEACLPWYINGTLDAETRNRITTALSTDARLRKALELAQDEVEAVGDLNEAIGAPPPRVLDNVVSKLPPVARSNSVWVRWFLAERFTAFMAAARPRTLVYAAVAAALVMTIQSGVIGMLAIQQNEVSSPELASAPGNGASISDLKLIIKFAPGAEFSKVADLLEEFDAEIVSGPSGGGLFTIGLEAPQDGEVGVERLIQDIRSKTGIVAFVSRTAP